MALLGPLVPAAAVTVELAVRQAPTLPRAVTYRTVPASSLLRCCCWHLGRPAEQKWRWLLLLLLPQRRGPCQVSLQT